MADEQDPYIVIHSLDEIPDFASEKEEAEFWDTHELSDELWDQLPRVPEDELPPPRPRGELIELLFTKDEFRRIKTMAETKKTNPWKLLKRFVLERLEEEEARDVPAHDRPRTGEPRRPSQSTGGPASDSTPPQ